MFPGAILCGGSWTGAGSGIRVARRVGGEGGGGGWFLFLGNVLLVLAKFSFLPGAGRWAIILWDFSAFLVFPKFLGF